MDWGSFSDFATSILDFLSNPARAIDILGYAGALLAILSSSTRTMIPLRIIGICANCLFIVYGYFTSAYPQLLVHCVLLPLNGMRLFQMLRLIKLVNAASAGDLSMDWIKPFTVTRACRKDETIFCKGDTATTMYYVVSGAYLLVEIGVEIKPGDVIGEMGLVAPGQVRTQTFRCIEDGELLAITYNQVKQLYFQNPRFGFYFLKLITQRMFANQKALEQRLTQKSATPA